MNYQIKILNPKAEKLLRDMADLELISISETTRDAFIEVVDRLRTNAASNPPNIEDITKEVELIRAERYAKKNA